MNSHLNCIRCRCNLSNSAPTHILKNKDHCLKNRNNLNDVMLCYIKRKRPINSVKVPHCQSTLFKIYYCCLENQNILACANFAAVSGQNSVSERRQLYFATFSVLKKIIVVFITPQSLRFGIRSSIGTYMRMYLNKVNFRSLCLSERTKIIMLIRKYSY